MDPLTLQIVGGVVIAVVALLIGLLLGRTTGKARKASDLADELEKTKEEFEAYRGEVVQQFADTAGKFRRLNESYGDLHKQLATSAAVLCADRADDVLLALPAAAPEAAEVESGDVIDADSESVTDAAAETAVTSPVSEEDAVPDSASDGATDAAPDAVDAAEITDVDVQLDEASDLTRELEEAAEAEKSRTTG